MFNPLAYQHYRWMGLSQFHFYYKGKTAQSHIHGKSWVTCLLKSINCNITCNNRIPQLHQQMHLYSQEEFPALKNELDYKYNHLLDQQFQLNE